MERKPACQRRPLPRGAQGSGLSHPPRARLWLCGSLGGYTGTSGEGHARYISQLRTSQLR